MLIVDGFAGPGRFGDGEPGSPLIIAEVVRRAMARANAPVIRLLCIERDPDLHGELQSALASCEFASSRAGDFLVNLGEIENSAKDHSTFLYLDPYTVEGLHWHQMDQVFEKLLRSRLSVEVLLNLNTPSFVRRGLSALKLNVPEIDPAQEDIEEVDATLHTSPSIKTLNDVVDGDWWQAVLQDDTSFGTKVLRIAEEMGNCVRSRFKEVCLHPMVALPSHTVPKYYLLFGSRHPDALRLMNDEMVKSRETLAKMAEPKYGTLFELRSEVLVPDERRIPDLVRRHCRTPTPRGDVILAVIRDAFCDFSSPQIRGCIERMLKDSSLKSATGKTRINDEVQIWIG